jgi:hypothetical protein
VNLASHRRGLKPATERREARPTQPWRGRHSTVYANAGQGIAGPTRKEKKEKRSKKKELDYSRAHAYARARACARVRDTFPRPVPRAAAGGAVVALPPCRRLCAPLSASAGSARLVGRLEPLEALEAI